MFKLLACLRRQVFFRTPRCTRSAELWSAMEGGRDENREALSLGLETAFSALSQTQRASSSSRTICFSALIFWNTLRLLYSYKRIRLYGSHQRGMTMASITVHDAKTLHRTDFMPGLGWFMDKSYGPMNCRKSGQINTGITGCAIQRHLGREVIFPQVPRVFHNGIKEPSWRHHAGDTLQELRQTLMKESGGRHGSSGQCSRITSL